MGRLAIARHRRTTAVPGEGVRNVRFGPARARRRQEKKWVGRDIDRPLSAVGYRQARGLVAALERIELRALFASPTTRCRQTLLALAAARGLRIDDLRCDAPRKVRACLAGSGLFR